MKYFRQYLRIDQAVFNANYNFYFTDVLLSTFSVVRFPHDQIWHFDWSTKIIRFSLPRNFRPWKQKIENFLTFEKRNLKTEKLQSIFRPAFCSAFCLFWPKKLLCERAFRWRIPSETSPTRNDGWKRLTVPGKIILFYSYFKVLNFFAGIYKHSTSLDYGIHGLPFRFKRYFSSFLQENWLWNSETVNLSVGPCFIYAVY